MSNNKNNFINKHDGFFSDYTKSQMFFKYFDDIISRKLVTETINNKPEEVDYAYMQNMVPLYLIQTKMYLIKI